VKVSYVSFNVARLGVPRGKKRAPEDAQTKAVRQTIADSLVEANGDVVGLQEVRSEASLEKFVTEHDLAESYPHREFFKTNDGGGSHMAILSRHPIEATQSHRQRIVGLDAEGRERKMTRDVAEADIRIGGVPTKTYVVHLKADPYFANNPTPEQMDAAEQRRLAERDMVSQIVAEDIAEIPSRHYVVMGDTNDDAGSATATAFLTDQTVPLVDPHQNLSGPESLSHPPSGRRLDVTYLSPGLADQVVPGSAQVLPWQESGSDHSPVKVTVEF
jgi:endonuclease/exonuclease/phosphatase family metal-dependent hydrolase